MWSEEHISLWCQGDMCSMWLCFPEHISLVKCVSPIREHISLGQEPGKHISLEEGYVFGETHFTGRGTRTKRAALVLFQRCKMSSRSANDYEGKGLLDTKENFLRKFRECWRLERRITVQWWNSGLLFKRKQKQKHKKITVFPCITVPRIIALLWWKYLK